METIVRAAVTVTIALVFSLGSLPLIAQEEYRGPDRGPSTHVPGVDVLNLPDIPFSATSNIEWTRVLEDGSTVVLELHANLARDNQGRVYRENHSFVPAGSGAKAPLNNIQIYDPVSRTHTSCSTKTFHCVVTNYKPRTFFLGPEEGANPDGTRYLQRQDLGGDRIEGVDVLGSRESVTIRTGSAGNTDALITTREYWYSPQLKTNLAVTRIDPDKESK
jgi:hypothetical protein